GRRRGARATGHSHPGGSAGPRGQHGRLIRNLLDRRGPLVNGLHRRGAVATIRFRFSAAEPQSMTEISPALARKIAQTIAEEIGAQTPQVQAAVALLDEGATVPFIARYRKEVTGGLDDTQLRNLEVRLAYLREMEDRRASILASIEEQGKLTDELRAQIEE